MGFDSNTLFDDVTKFLFQFGFNVQAEQSQGKLGSQTDYLNVEIGPLMSSGFG